MQEEAQRAPMYPVHLAIQWAHAAYEAYTKGMWQDTNHLQLIDFHLRDGTVIPATFKGGDWTTVWVDAANRDALDFARVVQVTEAGRMSY